MANKGFGTFMKLVSKMAVQTLVQSIKELNL